MDHMYISRGGLFLILVDSFSEWPEVIHVSHKRSFTVKYVLHHIFKKWSPPKLWYPTMCQFCSVELNSWLQQI